MIDKTSLITQAMVSKVANAADAAGANPKAAGQSEGSFTDVIGKMLESASAASAKSADLTKRLQMDDPKVSLEQTVLAMNSASLEFTAVVQARNKLMQAYNDIMNMPV